MKNNKTIDILIPAYNCERYIEKCLNTGEKEENYE